MKPPSKQTTQLWVALNLAQRSVFKTIDSALKAEGLPPLNWYDILWDLENASNGLRPMELKKKLLFEQSNLSRQLLKMHAQKLIEMKACPVDGRGKIVHISKKGRQLRLEMWQIYGPMMRQQMESVAKEYDASQITDALNSLVNKQFREDCA